MLGWPNRVQDVTITGGTWASAPFDQSNMQLAETSKVARTSAKTTAATKVLVDLGAARTIRVIAETQHNFPSDALRRVSAGTTSGATDIYAGDWEDVWGITFAEQGVQCQSIEDWWGPEIDSTIYGVPFYGLAVLPLDVTARYWTIEWDVTNSDESYLQIGRLLMAPVYQPDFNAVYGLVDGAVDYSSLQRLESGGIAAYPRRAARTVEFSLPATHYAAEEYRLREMLRRQRTTGDIIYVPDPESLEHCQMKGFVGHLDQLSGMKSHAYRFRSIDLKLTERL